MTSPSPYSDSCFSGQSKKYRFNGRCPGRAATRGTHTPVPALPGISRIHSAGCDTQCLRIVATGTHVQGKNREMNWILAAIIFCQPLLPTAQDIAQKRADAMAARNFRGHLPFNSRFGNPFAQQIGARFEGTGWGKRGKDPKTLGTCTPRRPMQLIADAVSVGRWGSYRVRLWR